MADKNWTEEDAQLLEEINKKLKEGTELTKEEQRLVNKLRTSRQDELAKLKEKVTLIQQAITESDNEYANLQRSRILHEEMAALRAKDLEDLRKAIIYGTATVEQQERFNKEFGDSLKKLDDALNSAELRLRAQKDLNDELATASKLEDKLVKATAKWAAAWESGQAAALAHKKVLGGIDSMMSKLWKASIEAMFAVDQAVSDFNKQFQLGEQYTTRITESYKALNNYGVTVEAAAKSQAILTQTVTDFTMASKSQQDAMTESQLVASRLGVEQQDYAQGVQNSMKFMGESMQGSIRIQGELAATARALGRDQKGFAAEYAKSGSALAKFGDQGARAFKELQHISKITGMEMNKVLGITNKFDTFEGAAEQAGKLNAALGGNMVNAMDLMMETDPAARFETIRDAILDTGLTFDDMSYYQKNFYKDALGLSDVGELAQMLSGDMDNLAGATNLSAESLIEQKERAQQALSVQEAFKAIIADNSELLVDLGKYLNDLTTWLLKNAGAVKVVIGLMIAYRTILMTVVFAKTLSAFWTAFQTAKEWLYSLSKRNSTAADVESTIAKKTNTGASIDQAAATKTSTRSMAGAVPVMVAFGFALLMIGAGIFLAATGFAILADSVAALASNTAALDAFTNIMIGFGIGFVALLVTLGILAYSGLGLAAVGIMVGFGQAILMVGAGVFLAAAGIGLMAAGFSLMFGAVDVPKLIALGLFFVGMIYAAPFLPVAALGMGAFALGLASVAIALALIPTRKMEALAEFTTSLSTIEVNQFDKVAESIERVAEAMDSIPTFKSIAIAKVIDSVTTATVVMRALGVTGPPAMQQTATQTTTQTNTTGGGQQRNIRQPLNITLNGDKMGEFILEVIGNEVKAANS